MSSSEAAVAFSPAAQTEDNAAIGNEALAQGLLLVRASALNLVRLQVAMERRDRPVALRTIDELMLLDRRLGDFAGNLAGATAEVRALEEQRRALLGESFALAAGVSGPRLAETPVRWIEQGPPPAAARAEAPPGHEAQRSEAGRGRGLSSRLVVALAFLALLAAAAAFFLLTETGRALIGASTAIQGTAR